MFTHMRSRNEQAGLSAARTVMSLAAAMVESAGRFADSLALTTAATFAWNVKPCVHQTAICTHGKPYARRLQEILT